MIASPSLFFGDLNILTCIYDYPTDHPQYVRLGEIISNTTISITRAPQQNDCLPSCSHWWIRFQMTIVKPHSAQTSKTKEFVVVLKNGWGFPILVTINGIKVKIVDSNYPGIYIDNKLDWTKYTVYADTVHKLTVGGSGGSTTVATCYRCIIFHAVV